MAKDSSERYLDNLLNSINGVDIEEDTSFEDAIGETSDDEFLKMFEAELESEDYSNFISNFELELEGKTSEKTFEDEIMDDGNPGPEELTLDEVLDRVEQHTEGSVSIAAEDDVEEEDSDISSYNELAAAVGNFDTSDSKAVDEFAELEGFEMLSEPDIVPEIGEPDLSGTAEASLEDMLGGDLAELGDMLSMEGEIENPEGDAFDNFAQKEMAGDSVEDTADKKKDKKKGGFFAKLAALLFGSDDEDEVAEADANNSDIESLGLSEENAQILRDLEGESATDKPKKEKKAKEKKAKEPKPKKAKPKKEKKPKPKKEKKEKKPKEPDNTPKLPKGPVIVIWIMALSLFALVIIGTMLIGSAVDMKSVKGLYADGSYTEALKLVEGHELKEDDEILKNKITVLAAIQSQLESHNIFVTFNQPVDALDSLICAAGRCQNYMDEAEALGITNEVLALQDQIELELKDMYNLTLDEVLEIYNIRDRNKYTIAVYRLCNKLGIKF